MKMTPKMYEALRHEILIRFGITWSTQNECTHDDIQRVIDGLDTDDKAAYCLSLNAILTGRNWGSVANYRCEEVADIICATVEQQQAALYAVFGITEKESK